MQPPETLIAHADGDAITEDIQPSCGFEPVELRHDVAAALVPLPARYREIILLRDLEGCSIQELAEQPGLDPEAAKSRLHRARLLAREHLDPGRPVCPPHAYRRGPRIDSQQGKYCIATVHTNL